MMRSFLNLGASAILITAIMLVGSLLLWLGIPLAWLYLASQVQGETNSIGMALGTALVGATVSIVAVASGLRWLDRQHDRLREARGAPTDESVLERVLVVAAAVALTGFTVWFLGFAGPGPSLAPQ